MDILHLRDVQRGYALLRLLIGANFLIHGLVRLPKLAAFADHTAQGFEGTVMPLSAARVIGLAIPIVELVLGGLVVLGLFTRASLAGLMLLMAVLTLGVGLQEKWPVASQQLSYGLVLFVLLALARCNRYSLDARLGRL